VVANEVVFKLDQAPDSRPLSDEEVELHKELELRSLGLASLHRTIVRRGLESRSLLRVMPTQSPSTSRLAITVRRISLNTFATKVWWSLMNATKLSSCPSISTLF
jgi:hypothetical protein